VSELGRRVPQPRRAAAEPRWRRKFLELHVNISGVARSLTLESIAAIVRPSFDAPRHEAPEEGPMILLNPKSSARRCADDRSDEIVRKTIAFFESKGKAKLKKDDQERTWYADFLEFVKRERVFSTFLTPSPLGGDGARWDTSRNCAMNEVLAFYGLSYWYAWQVSILGLGPIWMSGNEPLRRRAAKLLEEGGIFGFGLSEKEHGADIYSSDMLLVPTASGRYVARGDKYYIGNGNEAALLSVFGKIDGTNEYVFFAVDPKRPGYELVKNVVASQMYVAEFALHDYPVGEEDILLRGDAAWDAALNTVNVGKYNLGWASIGISTHAFYEAVRHAANRRLYGMAVTDFPHVKRMLTDAYARLTAMKLFALRASDYFRSASPEDRRYLLYNPVVKMKVTTEGEKVIDLLWDVIAAKGFEKDTYFEMATRDIRALPKLEGTVHVNIALIVKFMRNYLFAPAPYPDVPRRDDPADDAFFWRQGPARGLGKIRFHDPAPAFAAWKTPNVALFQEQLAAFRELLVRATPTEEQAKDVDFLLAVGELFTLVVYGQLVLESAALRRADGIDEDTVDQMFDVLVRDFSRHALDLHTKPLSTPAQMELALRMIRKPAVDAARYERVWRTVHAQKDAYEMSP
jgi:acyl-CoA dehydrogenase